MSFYRKNRYLSYLLIFFFSSIESKALSSNKIVLQELNEKNIQAIKRCDRTVSLEFFQKYYEEELGYGPIETREKIKKTLKKDFQLFDDIIANKKNKSDYVLGAFNGKQCVGLVIMHQDKIKAKSRSTSGEILFIGILESYRGLGIGRRLVMHLLEQNKRLEKLIAYVFKNNNTATRNAYLMWGFEEDTNPLGWGKDSPDPNFYVRYFLKTDNFKSIN